jgi:hypothetical protein
MLELYPESDAFPSVPYTSIAVGFEEDQPDSFGLYTSFFNTYFWSITCYKAFNAAETCPAYT